MRRWVAVALACVLTPSAARAGGFYVPEQGARGVAMGAGGVTASGQPAAMFHNPAALVGVETVHAEVSALVVMPQVTFFREPANNPFPTGPNDQQIFFEAAKSRGGPALVPFVGVASNLGIPRLAVGLGLFVPFGASLSMPENGAQRHIVTDVSLHAAHIQPTVAYRVWDKLSVGVGFSYIRSSFHLTQKNASQFVLGNPNDFPNPPPETEGFNRLEASDNLRFGGSAGLLWEDERWSMGASVMLPARLDMRGKIDVTNSPEAIVAMNDERGNPLPAGSRHDDIAVRMPMPLIARLGTRVTPAKGLSIALDVNWQRWSTMDRLTIWMANHYPLLPQPGAFMPDVIIQQKWRDSFSVRLGGEYQIFDALKARAGVLLDQSPIHERYFDVLTPDADKIGLSLGAGYGIPIGRTTLGIDLAYMHLFFAERTVNAETSSARTILNKPAESFVYGVTRTRVDLLCLSLSLRL